MRNTDPQAAVQQDLDAAQLGEVAEVDVEAADGEQRVRDVDAQQRRPSGSRPAFNKFLRVGGMRELDAHHVPEQEQAEEHGPYPTIEQHGGDSAPFGALASLQAQQAQDDERKSIADIAHHEAEEHGEEDRHRDGGVDLVISRCGKQFDEELEPSCVASVLELYRRLLLHRQGNRFGGVEAPLHLYLALVSVMLLPALVLQELEVYSIAELAGEGGGDRLIGRGRHPRLQNEGVRRRAHAQRQFSLLHHDAQILIGRNDGGSVALVEPGDLLVGDVQFFRGLRDLVVERSGRVSGKPHASGERDLDEAALRKNALSLLDMLRGDEQHDEGAALGGEHLVLAAQGLFQSGLGVAADVAGQHLEVVISPVHLDVQGYRSVRFQLGKAALRLGQPELLGVPRLQRYHDLVVELGDGDIELAPHLGHRDRSAVAVSVDLQVLLGGPQLQ